MTKINKAGTLAATIKKLASETAKLNKILNPKKKKVVADKKTAAKKKIIKKPKKLGKKAG